MANQFITADEMCREATGIYRRLREQIEAQPELEAEVSALIARTRAARHRFNYPLSNTQKQVAAMSLLACAEELERLQKKLRDEPNR